MLFASQTTEPGAERIESVSIDEDRGRWWLSERRLPYGRPPATCSSRGTVLCSQWRSTRARERRARGRRGSAERSDRGLASGQLALTLSSTGTLVFAPVGFRAREAQDGATLALDLLPSNQYANPGSRRTGDGSWSKLVATSSRRSTCAWHSGLRRRRWAASSSARGAWTGHASCSGSSVAPCWAAADGSGDSGPVPNATVNDFLLTRARSGLRHHPPPLSRDVGGCVPDVDERGL